jgi:hypothetical protein
MSSNGNNYINKLAKLCYPEVNKHDELLFIFLSDMSSHDIQADFTEDRMQDSFQKLMLEEYEIVHSETILQGKVWKAVITLKI